MRHYEIVAVIHPDQQGRIAAMIELYKKIVTDDGGVLHRLEDWGRRPLSYPIQNQHKAQYLLMNIECENATLEKLRETFRFSDSILRSLVTRREHAITDESPVKKADSKPRRSDATPYINEDVAEEGMKAVADNDNGADDESAETPKDDAEQKDAGEVTAESSSSTDSDENADDKNADEAKNQPGEQTPDADDKEKQK